DALQARSRCVLLLGSPGIGKTRTAEELWSRARARGAETWLGRCTEVDGAPAFWPFVQVLRDALRERGPDEVRALIGDGAAEIAQAMPELGELWPAPAAPSLQTKSERFRLFESVTGFLRRAAERRPIVLGFDDLHRADSATLQLLTFLVRQLDRTRILIVGTSRLELAAGEPQPLLDALAREERTRCIELAGFDRETIRRYLRSATGAEAPEFALAALHEQTAGNPLFVRQLVERWRATDATDWHTLASVSPGLDLRGAIQRHLEVATAPCRELLRAASVLGREFSSALLARVVDEPVDSVWLRLSQAAATQLIEACSEHGRFRFTHSLIRDALYRQLPAGERARLHGRAGSALEAQGIGSNYVLLAEVTRHFVAAAPAHDSGLALRYTLRAAESALSRLAYEEAAAHYLCALSLHEYAAPDPLQRMELLFARGNALARTTELDAARAALFEAFGLAREHGVPEMLFQSARLIAARPETGAVDAEQCAALRAAAAALPEHDERRVLLEAALAKSLVYGKERDECVGLARGALGRARTVADVQLRSEVLARCHEALVGPEHLAERVAIAAELLQLAEERGDPAALLRASQVQLETSLERGDMAAFDAALASMETLAERVREPFFRWHAKAVRGTQALLFGETALAERCARESLESGAPLGEGLARHMYCTQLVALRQLQGRPAEAEPLAREMVVRHAGVRGWVARVGAIDGMLGRTEVARRTFDEIMARGLDWVHREPFALSGLCSAADLCWVVRDAHGAKELYRALLPYADHYGFTPLASATYGPVARYLGVLADLQGDFALAEQHLKRALERAAALPSPLYLALCGAAYSELLLRSGGSARRAEAARVLQEAHEHGERSELHGITQYLSDLARRSGVLVTRDRFRLSAKRGEA
ncbi:MAG TPA: AAA family ATPase, partial [Polyangiales bacterium]|nr:AAA family ATPase [Polyangiales bacterium]